ILLLSICWLAADAVYISRMATVTRGRQPSVFRPGVTMQRPWAPPRLVQAASHRAPYVLYRGGPHRYISKPYTSAPRTVYTMGSGPWKTTTRLQHTASTPEYEFVRAAASHARPNGGTGAIHTIPAPNLSLSEKPIVVLETDSGQNTLAASSDAPKQIYEVTEKYVDPQFYHSVLGTKSVEAAPAGFSKHGSLSHQQDNNVLVRNAAALQLANELGFQAVAMPQGSFLPPQPLTIQFQGFHGIQQNHQDVLQPGLDGLVIPPNAFFQNNDPMFLQKIQNQLLQRYPAVEFVPYNMNSDFRPTVQQQGQTFVVTENDQAHSHQHLSVIPIQQNENDNHKTVVRETQEKTVVTLIPQAFVAKNVTEKPVEVVSVTEPQNVTVELVTADAKPATTTVKYIIEASTENNQKATPIYYAQVGQSVGDVIASGFYSAINDVRAAAALAQVSETQKPEETKQPESVTSQQPTTIASSTTTSTSTTINPDVKTFFIQNTDKNESNQTSNDLKPLLGVPFTKTDSVKVAYTLYRADDKDTKVTQDGKVYAGQIVEATISEDQDFNNEKANLISRRPPIRLIPVVENIEPQSTTTTTTTTTDAPKVTVVKAKIPPRSKLTFDDKTGEPVLRIYASYVDSPAQVNSNSIIDHSNKI
ncbi:hypothetical protein JYU34_006350, partial [Plutella xylostella]